MCYHCYAEDSTDDLYTFHTSHEYFYFLSRAKTNVRLKSKLPYRRDISHSVDRQKGTVYYLTSHVSCSSYRIALIAPAPTTRTGTTSAY